MEIAIPTAFFKAWTLFLVLFTGASTAVLCLTDWWQQFFTLLATALYVRYYYIGWPATILTVGILYLWNRHRVKVKRARQAAAAHRRRFEEATIEGNERAKKAEKGVKTKI